jgi:hypothetical protein
MEMLRDVLLPRWWFGGPAQLGLAKSNDQASEHVVMIR